MSKRIIYIFLAGIWIGLSEFIRNEFLMGQVWQDHFASLGLVFATTPINGILWLVWSFMMAVVLYFLLQKFTFYPALLLMWIVSFAMMWIVAFNLQVLPLKLLVVAFPLSWLEVFVAGHLLRNCTMPISKA